MSDDDQPDDQPEPDEDEAAKTRLGPWLRGLIREELEGHHERTQPAPAPDPEPAPTPSPTSTKKESDDDGDPRPAPDRKRRSAAELWFGRRS